MTILKKTLLFVAILIPALFVTVFTLFYIIILKMKNFVLGRESEINVEEAERQIYEMKNITDQ